jgi:hypothetical protein
MHDSDDRLFLAGMFAGLVAGVLGALLVRERRASGPPPLPEGGLVLRARSDEVARRAERAAEEALARARQAADGGAPAL